MTVCTKSYSPPPINRCEILRYAGAVSDTDETKKLLDSCLDELDCLVCRVCYAEIPIADIGLITADSRTIKDAVNGYDKAIVFAATVGIGIDRLIARYSVTSPAKALMLQAIGAERAEGLCDLFCEDIANGRGHGVRVSPGYGDIPLEAQRNIFALLDCHKNIGLTLTDRQLMSPTKSVTAIFGVKNENT